VDNKLIKLLKNQGRKLNSDDFDLESWKSSSIALLSKAFGPDDPLVIEIQKLKIDYGSWALRDAKASYDPMETCKKIGKDVIEIAIGQLETTEESNKNSKSILEKELQQDMLEPIYTILNSNKSEARKREELVLVLKKFDINRLTSLLARFIMKED